MKVYAFDVDETLETANGPVLLQSVADLRNNGDIVGLCGNFARITCQTGWHRAISFIGPMEMSKESFLRQISAHVPADEYVMVGNIQGVSGVSDDKGAAERAGWRFISERDFSEGKR